MGSNEASRLLILEYWSPISILRMVVSWMDCPIMQNFPQAVASRVGAGFMKTAT
jgi:hypothetical protein